MNNHPADIAQGTKPAPLTGIRVLDMTRVLAGPLATQMLGDLGADVIKVESPGGDDSRGFGPHFGRDADGNLTRESGFYLSANRNKRSIVCDFSTDAGRQRLLRLAKICDVFVENFKVGTLARHGLDYESVKAINSRIIYASLTGYGQYGPYAGRPGYDAVFQAQGGWMSVTGDAEGPWYKTGPSLVDVMSGSYFVTGILAALYHRDARGGQGQYLDVSLLDCTVAAMSHVAGNYFLSREVPQRLGNTGNGGAPSDVFRCSDGDIYISTGRQPHFVALCQVLGCPELVQEPRFLHARLRFEHRLALTQALAPLIARRKRTELSDALARYNVPATPLQDLAQVCADPQVQARGDLVEMPHASLGSVTTLANPLRFSDTPVTYRRPPPLHGEHDSDIE